SPVLFWPKSSGEMTGVRQSPLLPRLPHLRSLGLLPHIHQSRSASQTAKEPGPLAAVRRRLSPAIFLFPRAGGEADSIEAIITDPPYPDNNLSREDSRCWPTSH